MNILNRTFKIASVFAITVLAACSSVHTTGGGAVGVQRSQFMSGLVSEQSLQSEASQQYSEIMRQAKSKGILDKNAAQTKRIKTISQRLINQVDVFRPDAKAWNWEIHLLSNNEVNAWCMPGGKMAVYTGLINQLKPTDDELAAVLGHEIAHALREHSRERVSQQMVTGIGLSVLELFSKSPGAVDLGSQLTDVMFTLPNSREHEAEADRIGIELAARAGYNPMAAVSLWQKMDKLSGSRPPEFLSTHPSPASRQADLTKAANQVMPLYQKAK